MDQITIRDIPKATGAKARKKREKLPYHDLDHLFGIWTKEEAADFERDLLIQRNIDEGLWKKAE